MRQVRPVLRLLHLAVAAGGCASIATRSAEYPATIEVGKSTQGGVLQGATDEAVREGAGKDFGLILELGPSRGRGRSFSSAFTS